MNIKTIRILFIFAFSLTWFVWAAFAGGWMEVMPISANIQSWETSTWFTQPVTSYNNQHFVYTITKWSKVKLVLDWVEQNMEFDAVDSYFYWVFNDWRVFLKAEDKAVGKWYYMIWDFKSQLFDELNIYQYWDNWDIIAWSARVWNVWYSIFNKIAAWAYEYVDWVPSFTFWYKMAYSRATKEWKWVLLVNWVEIKMSYELDSLYVSTDMKKVIMVLKDSNWKKFVKIWKRNSKKYNDIYNVTLSNDWSNLMYIALTSDNKTIPVYNWEELWTYENVGSSWFSPLWKHYYFSITEWQKSFLIIDWKKMKSYDSIGYPNYSDDDQFLVYFAKEWDKTIVVVNWKEISK